MSHIVSVQTKLHDIEAIRAACQRLNLSQPEQGTAQLFSGNATGILVQLPGWQYPIVIDTLTGLVHYDNYGGHWGSQDRMDTFLKLYAVEKCRIEARKKGYSVIEQAQQDGSIKLQIIEGS